MPTREEETGNWANFRVADQPSTTQPNLLPRQDEAVLSWIAASILEGALSGPEGQSP